MFVKENRKYLIKINEYSVWPVVFNTIKTNRLWMNLTLKIRGKPKNVFGLLKMIKGDIYFLDREHKMCYGPGTKILSVN
ncbi:MAG: hypothetical protein WA063_03125 [Minisyncoccia bacterium]